MSDFVGPSYKLGDVQAACQRTVNMYVQRVGTPEKAQFILRAFPGFSATPFGQALAPPVAATFTLGFDDLFAATAPASRFTSLDGVTAGAVVASSTFYQSLYGITMTASPLAGTITTPSEGVQIHARLYVYGDDLVVANSSMSGPCVLDMGMGDPSIPRWVDFSSTRRITRVEFYTTGTIFDIELYNAAGALVGTQTINGTSGTHVPNSSPWNAEKFLRSFEFAPGLPGSTWYSIDVRRVRFTILSGPTNGRIFDNVTFSVIG